MKDEVSELSNIIRIFDGKHDKGAGEIAEHIINSGYRLQKPVEQERCQHDVHGTDCYICYPPEPKQTEQKTNKNWEPADETPHLKGDFSDAVVVGHMEDSQPEQKDMCPDCNGKGYWGYSSLEKKLFECARCNKTGKIYNKEQKCEHKNSSIKDNYCYDCNQPIEPKDQKPIEGHVIQCENCKCFSPIWAEERFLWKCGCGHTTDLSKTEQKCPTCNKPRKTIHLACCNEIQKDGNMPTPPLSVKWPEKKETIIAYRDSETVEKYQIQGWNLCHDAFMKAIEEAKQ